MNQHRSQTIAQGHRKALTGVVFALRRDDRLRRGVAIAHKVNRVSRDRVRCREGFSPEYGLRRVIDASVTCNNVSK